MKFRRMSDVDLRGKRVFIRCDLNVPLDGGTIWRAGAVQERGIREIEQRRDVMERSRQWVSMTQVSVTRGMASTLSADPAVYELFKPELDQDVARISKIRKDLVAVTTEADDLDALKEVARVGAILVASSTKAFDMKKTGDTATTAQIVRDEYVPATAAYLAAMIPSPLNVFNPQKNPKRLKRRQRAMPRGGADCGDAVRTLQRHVSKRLDFLAQFPRHRLRAGFAKFERMAIRKEFAATQRVEQPAQVQRALAREPEVGGPVLVAGHPGQVVAGAGRAIGRDLGRIGPRDQSALGTRVTRTESCETS